MLNTVETFSSTQLRDIARDAATVAGEYLASVFRRPDRKSTRLNSSHGEQSRMPSSA